MGNTPQARTWPVTRDSLPRWVGPRPGWRSWSGLPRLQLLVASGNDATEALASAAGGDRETVRLMADLAVRFGAWDTRVGDPTGLDLPGAVSSPYDLALIGRAALQGADIRSYVATRRARVRIPGNRSFEIRTHNRLLGTYPGCVGVKNGFTDLARATYIGAARRGGHGLVVVLLRADPQYAPEARALLDWGFAALRPCGPGRAHGRRRRCG